MCSPKIVMKVNMKNKIIKKGRIESEGKVVGNSVMRLQIHTQAHN